MQKTQQKEGFVIFDWLALPGIPAGSGVWERLPVRTLAFQGVEQEGSRCSWSLDSFVEEALPHYDERTILVGHDLGGVVASMAALKKPPRAVVLTGTALGSWWRLTRWSAGPIVNRFFYHTFEGGLFVFLGGGKTVSKRFPQREKNEHHPKNMRLLAQKMKPPMFLPKDLSACCPVFLVWGIREVFYPGFLAKILSRSMHAPLFWNEGGHYCMWTHAKQFHTHMIHIERIIQDSLSDV